MGSDVTYQTQIGPDNKIHLQESHIIQINENIASNLTPDEFILHKNSVYHNFRSHYCLERFPRVVFVVIMWQYAKTVGLTHYYLARLQLSPLPQGIVSTLWLKFRDVSLHFIPKHLMANSGVSVVYTLEIMKGQANKIRFTVALSRNSNEYQSPWEFIVEFK